MSNPLNPTQFYILPQLNFRQYAKVGLRPTKLRHDRRERAQTGYHRPRVDCFNAFTGLQNPLVTTVFSQPFTHLPIFWWLIKLKSKDRTVNLKLDTLLNQVIFDYRIQEIILMWINVFLQGLGGIPLILLQCKVNK